MTAHVPVGPACDALRKVRNSLEENGIQFVPLRRRLDEFSWPHTSHGYFKLKRAIPNILEKLGMDAEPDSASKAG